MKAFRLLTDECCAFVKSLSSIRNAAVHDARNFDLDIKEFIASKTKDPGTREQWKAALASWWVQFPVPNAKHEAAGRRIFDTALDDPKYGIFACAVHILALAHVGQLNAEQKQRQFQDGFYEFVRWPNP